VLSSDAVPKRLLQLILPASAGAEISLVNEDAQSCSLRIKAVLNTLGERERSRAINPCMRQEQQMAHGDWVANLSPHSPDNALSFGAGCTIQI
jgi:hypothetical protein